MAGVVPFLPGDFIKMILALLIAPQIRKQFRCCRTCTLTFFDSYLFLYPRKKTCKSSFEDLQVFTFIFIIRTVDYGL